MPSPKLKLNRVGILSRPHDFPSSTPPQQEKLKAALLRVQERLRKESIATCLLQHSPPKQPLDLIIVLGGDGSVLKALAMLPHCPVLAINYGGIGFLTAAESDDLENVIERLLYGDYVASERLLLECAHPAGRTLVVNEVALRSSWRMLSLEVFVNGARIRSIRGDGVIVGTPTGSTAYLLSCGGPIVMPNAQCLVLSGVNEYNFSSRPLILPDSADIHLKLNRLMPEQTARLYVDGVEKAMLKEGESITLRAASKPATLLFLEADFFFRNLSNCLSWH